MDYRAEADHAVEEMEWGDVINVLHEVIELMIEDAFNTPPSTLPPPALPAGQAFPSYPHLLRRQREGYGGCTHHQVGAAQYSFEQPATAAPEPTANNNLQNAVQSGHLYSQAGAYSQGQYLPYQSAVHSFPGTSTVSTYPAAPPHACNNSPNASPLGALGQNLVPIGLLNGNVVYIQADGVAPSNSAAPSLDTSESPRNRKDEQDDHKLYIKKPPNAFMLFRKEHRPNVVAELNITNCALVNKILGQKWKMLSKEEQAKYYKEAEKESLLHAERYPVWSPSDNYGKKRKRQRGKTLITAEASAFNTQEANELCVTPPSQTAVMQTSAPPTVPVIEAPHRQTVEMGPFTSDSCDDAASCFLKEFEPLTITTPTSLNSDE